VSPRAALHSEVFLAYLLIVAGTLAVAGAALLLLRLARGRPLGHPEASYRGWLIMAPAVLLAIFLGREATVALLTGAALLGLRELAAASELGRARALTAVVALGIVAGGVTALLPAGYGLFLALPIYVGPLLFLVPILGNRATGQLRPVGLALLAFVLLGVLFGHLAQLTRSRHAYGDLLFLIVAVEASDVAAYLVGRLAGRHPLRSAVSPGKTWEGAAGGLAVAMALPWVLRFSLPDLSPVDLVLAGLAVGLGGQLGDLAVSLVKRDLGVKDLGRLIPGHGGVLDRIDSLVVAAPLFVQLVRARDGL
jgi:phosphatidate cytidylyltransferase